MKPANQILCHADGQKLIDDHKVELWLIPKAVREQIQTLIDEKKNDLAFLERCKKQLDEDPAPKAGEVSL